MELHDPVQPRFVKWHTITWYWVQHRNNSVEHRSAFELKRHPITGPHWRANWVGVGVGFMSACCDFFLRILSCLNRSVSGFVTGCPCGVWGCGLTSCPLYVGPFFGKCVLNTVGVVQFINNHSSCMKNGYWYIVPPKHFIFFDFFLTFKLK